MQLVLICCTSESNHQAAAEVIKGARRLANGFLNSPMQILLLQLDCSLLKATFKGHTACSRRCRR